MSAKVQRTQQEFERAFNIQMAQLKARCDDYNDKGAFFESYSISTIIRVLVHDTRNSHSLLGQLGIKSSTQYLDSRVHNNLYTMGIMNGFSGLHARTRSPYKQYNDKNLVGFNEWWEEQEFKVVGTTFTRKELILKIANMEGGAHIDTDVDVRIAHINRSQSPYHAIDGDQTYPMYGAELASVCAIGEEILFSLTPEPENRKRMHWEPWQKPYYLSTEESDSQKELIRNDLLKLDNILNDEITRFQESLVKSAQSNIRKTLEIDCLTSEDSTVRNGTKYLMDQAKIPWEIE